MVAMTNTPFQLSDPFTHENLTLRLIHGPDTFDGSRFMALAEALEARTVLVHETGDVGQLEVENLSEHLDLYIQAGDIVKGAPGPHARGRFRPARSIRTGPDSLVLCGAGPLASPRQ